MRGGAAAAAAAAARWKLPRQGYYGYYAGYTDQPSQAAASTAGQLMSLRILGKPLLRLSCRLQYLDSEEALLGRQLMGKQEAF